MNGKGFFRAAGPGRMIVSLGVRGGEIYQLSSIYFLDFYSAIILTKLLT